LIFPYHDGIISFQPFSYLYRQVAGFLFLLLVDSIRPRVERSCSSLDVTKSILQLSGPFCLYWTSLHIFVKLKFQKFLGLVVGFSYGVPCAKWILVIALNMSDRNGMSVTKSFNCLLAGYELQALATSTAASPDSAGTALCLPSSNPASPGRFAMAHAVKLLVFENVTTRSVASNCVTQSARLITARDKDGLPFQWSPDATKNELS
jgi:hypothetical protein